MVGISKNKFIQKHLFFLVHLKGVLLNSFSKKSYSQWGEDIILGHIFSNQKDGFYIDVGAYHPMHYSNTYRLYKKGWSGINIDPNPFSIDLFNKYRKRDININCGIDKKVTLKPYYIFNHQSCNTFSSKQKDVMLKKSFIKLIDTKQVKCTTLQEVLEGSTKRKLVDFLNIDVEGQNLEVLESLDWNVYVPKVVSVEDDDFEFSKDGGTSSKIYNFLTRKSYILHAKVGLSYIYLLKK